MSIAVSVLTTSRVARNNGGAARQGNRPQSATAYSSLSSRIYNHYLLAQRCGLIDVEKAVGTTQHERQVELNFHPDVWETEFLIKN